MTKLKFPPSKIHVLLLIAGALIGINFNSLGLNKKYSSRFEAESACNESELYCHHDKETKQILGLDYQETMKFKLGWPVTKRYKYK